MQVSVGISNHHIHLKQETLEILFGDNYKLQIENNLNQPGQFRSKETLDIKTNKGIIKNVRIIGPVRNYDQIEISVSDTYILGLKPPIRTSGDLNNSETVTLIGPKGEVTLNNSCIIANRHIHITKEELEKYGFKEEDIVSVYVNKGKKTILSDVTFKISEKAFFELHLDTDDANACLLRNGDKVDIIKNMN